MKVLKLDDPTMKSFVEQVAEATSKRTVVELLTTLGFDAKDPIEAQREMSGIREILKTVKTEDYQLDQIHLRRWRKAMDSLVAVAGKAIIGLAITGMIAALWIGIIESITKGAPK